MGRHDGLGLTLFCFNNADGCLEEATETMAVSHCLFDSLLTTRVSKITLLTEVLKKAGLPGNEASRIRQWELILGQAMEDLRMLKTYRTPQALRAFARVFSIFLPPFYAPSYAQLAHDTDSLTFGIIFGVITSLALTALFESIRVLEDPFVANVTLDGIGPFRIFSLFLTIAF